MTEKEFRPKYTTGTFIGIFVTIIYDIYAISFVVRGVITPIIIFLIVILSPAIFYGLYSFIKKIIFRDSQIVIKRYLFPSKTHEFSKVIDIGETVIQTDSGNFMLQGMKNSNDLKEIFQEIKDSSDEKDEPFDNKLLQKQNLINKAKLPAGIISFVIIVIVLFFGLINFDTALGYFFVLFVIVSTYFIVYKIMSYLEKKQ